MSRKENWTFLHVGDSHMGTPRSYRFRPAVNRRWAAIKRQMAAIDADLLLHGGDRTRDGETHEFEYLQAREDLDTLPFPTFVIPGNMDPPRQGDGRLALTVRFCQRGVAEPVRTLPDGTAMMSTENR